MISSGYTYSIFRRSATLRAPTPTDAIPEIAGYDDTSYRVRLSALVRGYLGVAVYDREA